MYFSRVSYKPELNSTQIVDIIQDSGAYGLHRLMWGLFEVDQGKSRDFIYREELANKQLRGTAKRKADPVYYVVSEEQPKAEHQLLNIESKVYQPILNVGDKLAFKLRVNPVVSRLGKKHDIAMDSQIQWLNEKVKSIALSAVKDGSKSQDKKRLILENATEQDFEQWQDIVDSGSFAQVLDRRLTPAQLLNWVLKTQRESAIVNWWMRQQERGFEVVPNQLGQLPINVEAYQQHSLAEKGRNARFSTVDLSGEITVTDPEQFRQLLFNGIGRKKGFGCGLMLVRKVV